MPRKKTSYYGSKSRSAMKKAAKRRAETEEQREKRLKYGRINSAAKRATESVETREERLKKQREYMAAVRAVETRKQQMRSILKQQADEAARKSEDEQLQKLQCLKKRTLYKQKKTYQRVEPETESSEDDTLQQPMTPPQQPTTPPLELQTKQIDGTNLLQKNRFEDTFSEERQMFAAQPTPVIASSAPITAQPTSRHVQVLAPPGKKAGPKPVQKRQHQVKKRLVISNHQQLFMSRLSSLWKNRNLCDAAISNGTSTVKVHKVVLSAICPKLLSVFSTDILSQRFLQVNFPEEVSLDALNAFAEYMYNGILDLDYNILKQLKIIAKRLDMNEFEQFCNKHLPKMFHQSPPADVIPFTKLPLIQISMPTPTPTPLSSPVSFSVKEFDNHLPNHIHQSSAAASSSFTHIPLIQTNMPIPAMTSSLVSPVTTSIQPAPSITTQVINIKQEITDAELAQVQKDTTAVFGQESAVASLSLNKSGNDAGFVICPSIKTEPIEPDDNRYSSLSSNTSSNQVFTQNTLSSSLATASTSISSVSAPSTEFFIPFSQSTDVKSTRLTAAHSYETPLVSDLSPVSCIGETVCSQSSAMNEDSSKQLNRQSISASTNNAGMYRVEPFTSGDNQGLTCFTNVRTGSPHTHSIAMKGLSSKSLSRQSISTSIVLPSTNNEGVYPVGLFAARGDNLPLLTTEIVDVKPVDLYKTDLT